MQLNFFRMWHLLAGAALTAGAVTLWGFRSKNGDEWLKKLTEINTNFQEKYSSERVYLQLDKSFYKPSETIWFQAYVQDEGTLKPSKRSDILHVEFIDPKGNVAKKIQLILEDGTAAGEFDLTENAAGGLYKIKAYTQWQDNFIVEENTEDENGNSFIFEKEITVQKVVLPRLKMKLDFQKDAYGAGDDVHADLDLQSLTNEPLTEKEIDFVVSLKGQVISKSKAKTDKKGKTTITFELPKKLDTADGLLNVLISHNGQTESISRSIPLANTIFDLQFFPEGGDILANTNSNIAFWCKDEFGKPADIQGIILDSKGKKVSTFSSFHKGMGNFEFEAKENETYTAKITQPKNVETTYKLPETVEVGYGLKINYPVSKKNKEKNYETSNLDFSIYSPLMEEVFLVGKLRGQIIFSKKIAVKKGSTAINIPTDKMPIGVANFTLFDSKKIERAERLVFLNAEKQLNIDVKSNKEKYQPREKVTLDIKVTDHRGIPMPANLSLSVVDDKLISFADDKSSTILSNLLLEADLKGEIKEPRFYFDKEEDKAAQARDLLMLTHGWRAFTWEQVQKSSINLKYNAEKAIIAGTVNDENGKPAKNIKVEIKGKDISTKTDKNGYFEFKNYKLYESITIKATDSSKTATQHITNYSQNYSLNLYDYNQIMKRNMMRRGGAVPMMAAVPKDRKDKVVNDEIDFMEDEIADNIIFQNQMIVENTPIIEENEKEAVKEIMEEVEIGFKDEELGGFAREENQFKKKIRAEKPNKPVIIYHRARVFPKVDYSKKEENNDTQEVSRTDFRSTIFWSGNIKIDAKGKSQVEFYASDEITAFRVICEGVASDGGIGRTESVFYTQLPFSLDTKLPLFMSMGDKISIPLQLHNNTKKELSGTVSADYPSSWIPISESKWKNRITLQANETKVVNMDFLIENEAGKGKFIVQFIGQNGIQDRFEQEIEVFAKGFPAAVSLSGENQDKTYSFEITSPVMGTSKATFTAFPSVLDDLLAGIESILREPYGCFEQTSSSTYPNLLVMDYLSIQKDLNKEQQAALEKATALTEKGYKRLISFESKDKGYEWFGANPAHEALTAYGLMEFKDMAAVTGNLVDEQMLTRTTNWLMERKDGKGGFKRNPQALDAFGGADDDITNAYIIYSLSEAGFKDIKTEAETAYQNAIKSKDPYLIGLVVNTLQNLNDKRSEKLLETLISLQEKEGEESGAWKGTKHSITRSTGKGLTAETTSLALLALMKSDKKRMPILQNGVKYLVGSRSPYGGFGNTQSTVLALKSLTAYAKYAQRTPESGDIEIYVNSKKVTTAHYEAGQQNAIEVENLGKHLKAGKNTVRIHYVGVKEPLPYTFSAEWFTDLPKSSDKCSVKLETSLASSKVKIGETVRLTTTLENTTKEGLPMTIAIVGLPGGLSAQPWQLKELIEKNKVDFYEIRNHSVVFYYRQMTPNEKKTIYLDLKADLAGEYEGAASSAYLYYTSELKNWKKGLTVVSQ
ncbi:large extracellular alpha-helical protein [Bernardetia litoralis DSM 6794]|uniref:Large extracellular alpha-helical protein n=1 Tax=Bernardetia litoralis (strain ATCC 23117 / DSM 6794 / NBRC 15988 / NCIMB 1366 / Fx l1 / Sio-4) TaxID=880071 RepID=I4AP58_BERLS|nr:MG2 domain-containing protein [Bernardetia litoralis]AFM05743.1 large extracellular alpha-helical protein [Bernardetia litoralis DSM 6794]